MTLVHTIKITHRDYIAMVLSSDIVNAVNDFHVQNYRLFSLCAAVVIYLLKAPPEQKLYPHVANQTPHTN